METIGFAGVQRSCTTAQLLESSMTELFYLRYTTGTVTVPPYFPAPKKHSLPSPPLKEKNIPIQ